jgi:hypothetical protein
MGFNSAFKGLSDNIVTSIIMIVIMVLQVPNEKFLGLCAKLDGEGGTEP